MWFGVNTSYLGTWTLRVGLGSTEATKPKRGNMDLEMLLGSSRVLYCLCSIVFLCLDLGRGAMERYWLASIKPSTIRIWR